jgi:glutathione S-transferase
MLKIIDDQLAKHPFVAGANFSVADITAMVAVDFMKPAKIELPTTLVNVARWHKDVSARPSAKA